MQVRGRLFRDHALARWLVVAFQPRQRRADRRERAVLVLRFAEAVDMGVGRSDEIVAASYQATLLIVGQRADFGYGPNFIDGGRRRFRKAARRPRYQQGEGGEQRAGAPTSSGRPSHEFIIVRGVRDPNRGDETAFFRGTPVSASLIGASPSCLGRSVIVSPY